MACLLEPKGIEAKCPYCEDMRFWVECPQEQQSKPEVECLPYTRDIGKFDDGKWTQIGSDFHSTILGWERIGILYTTPGQKVFYRVVGCHQCNYLFEVYANYTFRQLDKLRFAEMWPHLFKSRGDRIKKYKKETLTKRILDNYSLTSFFSCILFIMSFVPDIVGNWETLQASGSFEPFILSNRAKLLMRGISCLSLVCILQISFSFIHYLDDSAFEKLFKINHKRSLVYWKNYTRARFVGVKKEKFSPNQAMVIAGIPTVVVLLLIWILYQARSSKAAIHPLGLLYILVFVILAYMLITIFIWILDVLKRLIKYTRFPYFSNDSTEKENNKKVMSIFFPINIWGISISLISLFVGLIYLTKIYQNKSSAYISTTLFELFFWIIISYYIGTSTWSILEIPVYILKGVKKIPMYLDPLDRFKNLVVLERFGQTSIIGMVIIFVLALSLSICQAFLPTEQGWIVIWSQAAFIGLYIVIAIILESNSRVQLVLIAAIYILLQIGLGFVTSPGLLTQIFPSLKYVPFTGKLHLYQYLSLALFGLFSSYIFYLQFRDIGNTFKSLREEYKNKKLEFYQGLMYNIEKQLREFNNCSNQVGESERKNLLGSINEVIDIIEKINHEYENLSSYRQIKGFFAATGIMSPFMSAIITPTIINYLTRFIPNPWK